MDEEKEAALRRAIRLCNPVVTVDDIDKLVELFESMGVEILRVA